MVFPHLQMGNQCTSSPSPSLHFPFRRKFQRDCLLGYTDVKKFHRVLWFFWRGAGYGVFKCTLLTVHTSQDDGTCFLSSGEIIKRNSVDQGLIAWDWRTGARLSNQIYVEGYTCTCVKRHPTESFFVAQSTADYIALFEATKPYRLNRRKVGVWRKMLISVTKDIKWVDTRLDAPFQRMVIILHLDLLLDPYSFSIIIPLIL